MKTIVVFAYNFRHKKTQAFLVHLRLSGYAVARVLAADKKELDIPPSSIRTKIRHRALRSPRLVAERMGFDFLNADHDSEAAHRELDRLDPDLGVIAGARVLPKSIIEKFRIGIINFHPGLLPEVRGLDAMLWSVREDVPLGATAHLIDEHVDAGEILLRRKIEIYEDDTALDLNERLFEVQLELLEPAVEKAFEDGGKGRLTKTVDPNSSYNTKMPSKLERETVEDLLPEYVARRAG